MVLRRSAWSICGRSQVPSLRWEQWYFNGGLVFCDDPDGIFVLHQLTLLLYCPLAKQMGLDLTACMVAYDCCREWSCAIPLGHFAEGVKPLPYEGSSGILMVGWLLRQRCKRRR